MQSLNQKINESKKELLRMRKESPMAAERNRANILLALNSGLSRAAVARTLAHARSTVISAAQRFETHGLAGLRDLRRTPPARLPGRDNILSLLPKLAAKQPQDYGWQRPTWSVATFAREVCAQTGTEVSRTHMGRLLHQTECRRARPKPSIRLQGDDAKEKLAALEAELDTLPAEDVVLYEDEVDLHLNPKIGPDWMPKGVRKTVVTPGRNEKWYMAGALERSEKKELLIITGRSKTSDLFIALCQDVAHRYAHRGVVHLVVDNYMIHHSKKTQSAVEALAGKVVLHYLPPYSPEGNPIERVWLNMHNNVTRNHRHTDIESVVDSALNYLDNYDGRGARAVADLRMAA